MQSLKQALKRLRDRSMLAQSDAISIKDLSNRFQPDPAGSLRALLLKMNGLADEAKPTGGSTHPAYRRSKPVPQDAGNLAYNADYINLDHAHLEPYGESNPVDKANRLFDKRAAAAIRASAGGLTPAPPFGELLEPKSYGGAAPDRFLPTARSLAVIAYPDYFPSIDDAYYHHIVSEAISAAQPGWCGTFGPGGNPLGESGSADYDMSQMHLLQIAYRYYDELLPEAQEHLITQLLAGGNIYRPHIDDPFTSTQGPTPSDYSLAGVVTVSVPVPLPLPVPFLPGVNVDIDVKRVGETENHILMILTARYLTNQLLYQRNPNLSYDNRRNGAEIHEGEVVQVRPNTIEVMLSVLRNILRDDFSEYNAKGYQLQTRRALTNLCSYAYDHEVRLAAQMALDYISAHIAVSSNDLRRMVPFRRRNEDEKAARTADGFMAVALLETSLGADPLAQTFAILAGNTRAYETPSSYRTLAWGIKTSKTDGHEADGHEAVIDALSDYRLPPSIHDLFVNDMHRRFFQVLRRIPLDNVEETGRNCENLEIYASSPSYLITAGGSPGPYAINPGIAALVKPGKFEQQLGVAVTTSFMPTGLSAGPNSQNFAQDLIQFGSFASGGPVLNYGVAPDFACGHQIYLPEWLTQLRGSARYVADGNFTFIDRSPEGVDAHERPGFYLAIYQENGFALLEAFDMWLHPEVTFADFQQDVKDRAAANMLSLQSNVATHYRTWNGNQFDFTIILIPQLGSLARGATVSNLVYGDRDPRDGLGRDSPDMFLNGTVMNGQHDGVVEITNHDLGTKLILDMRDPFHPRRVAESGEVEQAGSNHEVWVDFAWAGPFEGDFYRPFNTIAAAVAAVASGGVVKIMPGWTNEKPFFANDKRVSLVAPAGGVTFGVR